LNIKIKSVTLELIGLTIRIIYTFIKYLWKFIINT
jgi:hypothetical protein